MFMVNNGLIAYLRNTLQEKLSLDCPDVLNRFPIEEYVDNLAGFPKNSNYDSFSATALRTFQSMKSLFDQKIIADYHKLVLLFLIESSVNLIPKKILPFKVYYIYIQSVWHIIQKIKNNQYSDDWFDLAEDKFCKEVALCSLRMIPTGPRLIIKGHISPRFLFTGGFKQFFKGLIFLIFKIKGLYPAYELHMNHLDPVLMSYFNEKGWYDMFFILADILKRDKTIKAIVGNGWLYDPEVGKISSHLGFIRFYAEKVGATIFKVKSDEAALYNSLYKNTKRQTLYEEGKYIPTNYIAIFPRKTIIQWAAKHSKLK